MHGDGAVDEAAVRIRGALADGALLRDAFTVAVGGILDFEDDAVFLLEDGHDFGGFVLPAAPYLAFALLIYAGLYGIKNKPELPEEANINLYKADEETLKNFTKLPSSLEKAKEIASKSDFIKTHIPSEILNIYLK